jgi:hypothetical protein
MAKLKAGTVRNLQTDTLAGAMDAEFVALWASLDKDTELPTDTRALEDRRLMFVAIARGLLSYLYDHRDDIETTDESTGVSGTEHDHQLEFDWE